MFRDALALSQCCGVVWLHAWRVLKPFCTLWGAHVGFGHFGERVFPGEQSRWQPRIPAGVGDVPRVRSAQDIPAWEVGSAPEPHWGIRSFKPCPGCAAPTAVSPRAAPGISRAFVTAPGSSQAPPSPSAPAEPVPHLRRAWLPSSFPHGRRWLQVLDNCLLCFSLWLKPST